MRIIQHTIFQFYNKMTSTQKDTESSDSPYYEINRVYCELLCELQKIFPTHADKFQTFSNELAVDSAKGVIFILGNIFPFMEDISQRQSDNCIALGDKLLLVPGFAFATWWGAGKMDIVSQDALWKFLHTFYYLVSTLSNLDKLVESHFPSSHELHVSIIRSLINHQRIASQILTSVMFKPSVPADKSETSPPPPRSHSSPPFTPGSGGIPGFPFDENSMIGKLAQEISREIDVNSFQDIKSPADLFRSLFGGGGGISGGGSGNGIGRLISTVGQKLHEKMSSGNLNEMNLMTEATNMMSMMSPMYTQLLAGSGLFAQPGGNGNGTGNGNGNHNNDNNSDNNGENGEKKKRRGMRNKKNKKQK